MREQQLTTKQERADRARGESDAENAEGFECIYRRGKQRENEESTVGFY